MLSKLGAFQTSTGNKIRARQKMENNEKIFSAVVCTTNSLNYSLRVI